MMRFSYLGDYRYAYRHGWLNLLVDQAEIEKRLKSWQPLPKPSGGYQKLYVETVMQANQGCDLDFLTGASGSVVDRESH